MDWRDRLRKAMCDESPYWPEILIAVVTLGIIFTMLHKR